MKILYIEDNDIQGNTMKRMLEIIGGHEVYLIAESFDEVIEAREAGFVPDLIMTDLNLPTMSGHEVIDAFRNDPTLAQAPIVVLSADIREQAEQKALEAGADAYFSKPANYRELSQKLEELVARSKEA